MSYNLNFNLIELCSYSLAPSAVIVLEYLHLNYQKFACYKLVDLSNRLNIDLPDLCWNKILRKKQNYRISNFKISKPMTTFKYAKLLTLPIPAQEKFLYLYYTALLAPYDNLKFIPKEVFIGNTDSLIFTGLVEEVENGIILIHER